MIERVCENCKHWSGGPKTIWAPCLVDAVAPDVGSEAKATVLLPPRATCLAYDDAFEPSDVYLDYLRAMEAEDDR